MMTLVMTLGPRGSSRIISHLKMLNFIKSLLPCEVPGTRTWACLGGILCYPYRCGTDLRLSIHETEVLIFPPSASTSTQTCSTHGPPLFRWRQTHPSGPLTANDLGSPLSSSSVKYPFKSRSRGLPWWCSG